MSRGKTMDLLRACLAMRSMCGFWRSSSTILRLCALCLRFPGCCKQRLEDMSRMRTARLTVWPPPYETPKAMVSKSPRRSSRSSNHSFTRASPKAFKSSSIECCHVSSLGRSRRTARYWPNLSASTSVELCGRQKVSSGGVEPARPEDSPSIPLDELAP